MVTLLTLLKIINHLSLREDDAVTKRSARAKTAPKTGGFTANLRRPGAVLSDGSRAVYGDGCLALDHEAATHVTLASGSGTATDSASSEVEEMLAGAGPAITMTGGGVKVVGGGEHVD